MVDTKQRNTSKVMIFLVATVFLLSGAPIRFSGRANPVSIRKEKTTKPSPDSGHWFTVQSGPTYNKLLQDDSSGDQFRFNSTTGEYIFSRCSNGYSLSGTGSLTVHSSTYTLTHNAGDRRVTASLDDAVHRGNASVQVFALGITFTIMDRNTLTNPGLNDSSPPQVGITAPNGGEIIDTASSFVISWTATDDMGIVSQDLQLSTDGGNNWTSIAPGLAGTVNSYAWTVPVITNNQTDRVRIIARDAACNAGVDSSDANFTIWNPPASFTHNADAPIYITSGGYEAFIYLCSEATTSVVAEVDFRQPTGGATASAPAQLALAPGDARKIRVADYLTLGTSGGSIEGSIGLRHNGTSDSDVRALLVVNKFGEEQSFTAPFIYTASSQAAGSTMQCSPIYYVDDLMTSSLAVQNTKNYPVDVSVKLVYGTGDPGTPNGTYYLPTITLGGQGRLSTNLGALADQLQGAKWGSIVLTAPPQSVAAHTVMRSAVHGVACSASFVDPMMSINTTKVAMALKLDYDAAVTPCVMVCNTSSVDTRTVTANFQTDSGVSVPSQQVTIGPGQQKMIVLDPQQLLAAHQSAMADVRLSYAGNASDIIAGGVSMSSAEDFMSGASFVEPRASDGRQLVSPFFRVDPRTPGFVQLSNLGTTSVKAGVSMKFVNSTLNRVTTDLVTVPAGRTATLNVQQYIEQAPDGLTAEGCIELIHNGVPGTVTASFVSMTPDPVEAPLEAGPPICETMVFPNEIDTQPGETTLVHVITCGGQGAVVWTTTAGTITPGTPTDPDVYPATFTAPDDESEPDTVTIQVTSPSGVGTSEVEVQKVKLRSIDTSNAQGGTEGRLNPDGGTTFVLTGKRDFPAVPLQVKFVQEDNEVSVDIPIGNISGSTLTGTAPPNTRFVGDAVIKVFAGDAKISKKTLCDETGCSAYYAFEMPSPPTSLSNAAFNRSGGNTTIIAVGGGFREFLPSDPTASRVPPRVNFDGLGFEVSVVTPTTINGNVQKAGPEFPACVTCGVGQQPCRFINVRNPGGRARDTGHSTARLYTLLAGPAPFPQSRFPDSGFSIGGTVVTIKGENLDFVDNVTIGGTDAPIISKTDKTLVVSTLPHIASPGSQNPITLFDIDCAAPSGTVISGGGFTYQVTPVTPIPGTNVFIVGPGEGIDLVENSLDRSASINCISQLTLTLRSVAPPPSAQTGVQATLASGTFTYCLCTQTGSVSGTITYTLSNTAQPMNNALRRVVTRNVTINHYGGIGSCNGSF